MNYFITRDGQQYGPYTLSDLQRYVASGEILLTDLAFSEGMAEPLPVSQIIGTIPVPQPVYQVSAMNTDSLYPDPPNLHWGLVLLFDILSCGLFQIAWDLVQSSWMKKVAPQSKAFYYYCACAGCGVLIFFVSFFQAQHHHHSPLLGLLQIADFILVLIGRFSLKASLEQHFNTVEPMALQLSGVMTFFFGGIYFQYHLNDIVRRKNFDRMTRAAV
ncbi:DUF4339 domain-containing protein [Silvibacterium acidisoli]|uniref:DUF4339 domain-containing protein n=1 Tax=Acidobacteriaceae bacterium ZG23-2 TaxID=2883246 RepID=UPI00406D01A4